MLQGNRVKRGESKDQGISRDLSLYALPSFASPWSSCTARIVTGIEPACLRLPHNRIQTVKSFPAT
jgi:hypothetical protein